MSSLIHHVYNRHPLHASDDRPARRRQSRQAYRGLGGVEAGGDANMRGNEPCLPWIARHWWALVGTTPKICPNPTVLTVARPISDMSLARSTLLRTARAMGCRKESSPRYDVEGILAPAEAQLHAETDAPCHWSRNQPIPSDPSLLWRKVSTPACKVEKWHFSKRDRLDAVHGREHGPNDSCADRVIVSQALHVTLYFIRQLFHPENSRHLRRLKRPLARAITRSRAVASVSSGTKFDILAGEEDTKLPRTQSRLTRVWPL